MDLVLDHPTNTLEIQAGKAYEKRAEMTETVAGLLVTVQVENI